MGSVFTGVPFYRKISQITIFGAMPEAIYFGGRDSVLPNFPDRMLPYRTPWRLAYRR